MTATPALSAAAFVLQATPWTALVVRRGSSAEVSVQVPAESEDGEERDLSSDGAPTVCLVWQFRVDEYDIAFQMLENGRPLQEPVRYQAAPIGEVEDSAIHARDIQPAVSAEGTVSAAKRGSLYTFRWDNSYSFVRHKRVFYRFSLSSQPALKAAQTAASETLRRRGSVEFTRTDSTSVKPHLAKRLALERRLTVDEASLEQTRFIEQLQRYVTDMVSTFMSDPDRPLHEGSVREFLLTLEAVLRNGIKEKYLRTWPEEPYYEFLLQVETVLRNDKGLAGEIKGHPVSSKLQYLGWTKSRALLMMALNKNMLHYAFENLVKRRSIVEAYYDPHALLYMYTSATQIVAYLSALNGVKFLLEAFPDETYVGDCDMPPNLKQCAPNDKVDGELIIFQRSMEASSGYVYRSGSQSPSETKSLAQCSVARNILAAHEVHDMSIGRGMFETIQVAQPGDDNIYLLLQVHTTPGELAVSLITNFSMKDYNEDWMEPVIVSPDDGWVDFVMLIATQDRLFSDIMLKLDNSKAMMRTRQVRYRYCTCSIREFEDAWESCQGVAQSITWKATTKAGVERCERYMDRVLEKHQQEVAYQELQRSREASGATDIEAEESLLEMGASLITKPVSFFVGGLLGSDSELNNSSCSQCDAVFSFFSRQYICPFCQMVVCIPCSRHAVERNGKGPQVKVCDRCFIKEKDAERRRRALVANTATSGSECAAYAALREEPTMEKYFKMLSFGVPHSGVVQKMLQDEMPSDKITVFSAGPSGASSEQLLMDHGAGVRCKNANSSTSRVHSFRKVHWQELDSNKVQASIWNRVTSRRRTAPIHVSPQDFEAAVRLFGRDSSHRFNSPGVNPAKKTRVYSALDSRRSNNISIGVSQFKSIGGTEKILRSLRDCDFEFLSSDRLASIYDIAPTSVETKRYSNFRGNRSRLEPAEMFLVDMCEIPRVTEKIAAMRFVAQFESQYQELRARVHSITNACLQLLQSERLARCFELILVIGNLLNSGTEIENAEGVTLESLLKLSETKSLDQTTTLLQFIVRLIHDRGEADLLQFLNELDRIAEAKRYSNIICLSQAKSLQTGLRQAEGEIKEEMIIDAKKFEITEKKRQEQFERAATKDERPAVQLSSESGNELENPRAALMTMLQTRNKLSQPSLPPRPESDVSQDPREEIVTVLRNRGHSKPNDVPKEDYKPSSSSLTNPRGAILNAIQNSDGGRRRESPVDASASKVGLPSSESSAPVASALHHDSVDASNPRSALLAAIQRKRTHSSHQASPHEHCRDAQTIESAVSHAPSRANLLTSIRSRRPRENSETPSDRNDPNVQGSTFTRRVYTADNNSFIRVMKQRVFAIKSTMEDLEADIEAMVSVWESTARYLGEDPVSSSSDYLMNLLNRFILDVKIAKALLLRQGLSFQTPQLNAPVGSVVATVYGAGVVTAIRSDSRLEISFQWSREAYISPRSVLSFGALVRCRLFGLGIIHSTQYDRGFCRVRFPFGYGIVRVQDLTPVTSPKAGPLKESIHRSSFRCGDPVVTPFGCGVVHSIVAASSTVSRTTLNHEGYVAVNMVDDSIKTLKQSSSSVVAYVHFENLKMNY